MASSPLRGLGGKPGRGPSAARAIPVRALQHLGGFSLSMPVQGLVLLHRDTVLRVTSSRPFPGLEPEQFRPRCLQQISAGHPRPCSATFPSNRVFPPGHPLGLYFIILGVPLPAWYLGLLLVMLRGSCDVGIKLTPTSCIPALSLYPRLLERDPSPGRWAGFSSGRWACLPDLSHRRGRVQADGVRFLSRVCRDQSRLSVERTSGPYLPHSSAEGQVRPHPLSGFSVSLHSPGQYTGSTGL